VLPLLYIDGREVVENFERPILPIIISVIYLGKPPNIIGTIPLQDPNRCWQPSLKQKVEGIVTIIDNSY
jgi:hypothetical protein